MSSDAMADWDHRYVPKADFNPFIQTFTILYPDGVTPFTADVESIQSLEISVVYQAISQGVQMGAASILLIALLLVTKTDKRRSQVFLLNALALLLVIVRGIISCLLYSGPFYNWYRWAIYYFDNTDSTKITSICGEVITLLLIAVVEISLVLQVRIVCCNLHEWQKLAINISNAFIAFCVICMRAALATVNAIWGIWGVQDMLEEQWKIINSVASATNILHVISIGYAATIFCIKLFVAIRARRSMGMTQFGPMQIIFVMGLQTMLLPLIFTIVAYWGIEKGQMQSFVPTSVALMLPLSALWASANTNHVHVANVSTGVLNNPRPLLIGASNLASGKAYGVSNKNHLSTCDTYVDDDVLALTPPGKRRDTADSDLEVQKGVYVDRTYSVRSD